MMGEIIKAAFSALAPVYLIIVLGYVCKRLGIVTREEQPRMNALGFKVFLPALQIYNIYNSKLNLSEGGKMAAFIFVALFAIFFLTVLYTRICKPADDRRGVMIQAITRSNSAILGMPIALALYPDASAMMALGLAVVIPVFNLLAVITLEVFGGKKAEPKRVIVKILTNPLLVGTVIGLVLNLTGITIPSFLNSALKSVSSIATPFLLFLLGVFFELDFKFDRDLVRCVAGKLLIVPAVVSGCALLLGFRGITFLTILVLSATPTAVASFAMVQQIGGDCRLAGNAVVVSSVFSFVTMLIWICLFMAVGVI